MSEEIAAQKNSAMLLKSQYLNGELIHKDTFRNMFIESEKDLKKEETLCRIPVIAKSILGQLNIERIQQAKSKNIRLALNLLINIKNVNFNLGQRTSTGFGLVIECNSNQQRENFRSFLIKNKIYPAVLWPNQFEESTIDFERRMLFVHMDYRYTKEDIIFITDKIKEFFNHE